MSEQPGRRHALQSFVAQVTQVTQVAQVAQVTQVAQVAQVTQVTQAAQVAQVAPGAGSDCGVLMQIAPFHGYLNLRGNATDAGFLEAVASQLGQRLPLTANTFTQGAVRVFWLGPDEWLVMAEPGGAGALEARLADSLAGRVCALTDLTGSQICIQLSGNNARDVLAKGCTLDLHPRVFQPGHCAQTVLGKASMLIALSRTTAAADGEAPAPTGDRSHWTGNGEVFDIVVRRTFADYAAEWLYHGAGEYGVTVDCDD